MGFLLLVCFSFLTHVTKCGKSETEWGPGHLCRISVPLVPRVEFMYIVCTRMPGESNCRWLTSLLLYLCYIFWALINSLLCYKNVSLCSDKWLASQSVECLACQNLQLCNFSRHHKCDKSETLLWTRYNHCTLPGHTTFTLSDLDQCYFMVYAELDSFSGIFYYFLSD